VYPLEAGEILLDGRLPGDVPQGLVGYAPQTGYLFSGSVRDNVYLDQSGRSAASMLPCGWRKLAMMSSICHRAQTRR
jgi:ABC-type multidrug transport system fused ATPase/permease subunit